MPVVTAEDADKMKVVELRAELSRRGLETKGIKPVLLARLKEAIAAAASADGEATPAAEVKTEQGEPSEGEGGEQPASRPEMNEGASNQTSDAGGGDSLTVKPSSELMPTEPTEEAQEWQRKYEEAKKAREQGAGSSNSSQV